jgi:hypothetical protein
MKEGLYVKNKDEQTVCVVLACVVLCWLVFEKFIYVMLDLFTRLRGRVGVD